MRALKERSPFIPEVHLFHDREKFVRFFRKAYGADPEIVEDAGAQAWCDKCVAAVLMQYDGGDDVTELSLMCHEAYHIAELHYAYLGEENVGGEFMAYGVQIVGDGLMRAHLEWKDKRCKRKRKKKSRHSK